MPVLSDTDIQKLFREPKAIPKNFRGSMKLKSKLGHNESECTITGDTGAQFLIVLRSSQQNPLDFSVILEYQVPKTNIIFRLCRYNGKSHEHTNKIERQTFYDFHIHRATERYQMLGMAEDSFAEPTNQYSDLDTALSCLLKDCGFVIPPEPQLKLWEERASYGNSEY